MTHLFGIIGRPLGHSFSARYFGEKFAAEGLDDHSYSKFELSDISELPALVASHPDLRGFNVTIPYKQQVIPLLDALSPEAERIGAVNCVKVENGRLTGYNTDALGFRNSLLELLGEERPAALVLGTGGASKAVKYILAQEGIDFLNVSRTPGPDAIAYHDLDRQTVQSHPLIVNATPLGTYPAVEGCPDLPYRFIGPRHRLFDLVYNPPLTAFLARGRERGARIMNGSRMLIDQAEKSWEIWNAR